MKNGQKLPDVLTLPEAAKFLRLSLERTEQLARSRQLPGRPIDQEWRFLRKALEEWLRGGGTQMKDIMDMAGIFKGDESLVEICREAYQRRRKLKSKKNLQLNPCFCSIPTF